MLIPASAGALCHRDRFPSETKDSLGIYHLLLFERTKRGSFGIRRNSAKIFFFFTLKIPATASSRKSPRDGEGRRGRSRLRLEVCRSLRDHVQSIPSHRGGCCVPSGPPHPPGGPSAGEHRCFLPPLFRRSLEAHLHGWARKELQCKIVSSKGGSQVLTSFPQ